MLREGGNSETGSQRKLQIPAAAKMMLRDLFADAPSHRSGEFYLRIGQHNHKFVASVARYGIGVANGRENDRRHLHQHVGADQVAMSIINSLEVVEVEKQGRHAGTIAARSPDLVKQK